MAVSVQISCCLLAGLVGAVFLSYVGPVEGRAGANQQLGTDGISSYHDNEFVNSALFEAENFTASAEMGPDEVKEAVRVIIDHVVSAREEFRNKMKQVTLALQHLAQRLGIPPPLNPISDTSGNPNDIGPKRFRRSFFIEEEADDLDSLTTEATGGLEETHSASPSPQDTKPAKREEKRDNAGQLGNSVDTAPEHVKQTSVGGYADFFKKLETRVEALEISSRRTSMRSCHGIKETGVKKSGKYVIDPDGVDIGHPAIEVYCDFSGDDALTVVSHVDVNKSLSVKHCRTPGCFKYDAQYDAVMGQISALIDMSTSCFQEINYQCFHAPLSAYGIVHNSWWIGRRGAEKYYWSGLHSDDHTCACGLAKNCTASPALKCNCDTGALEWLADVGILRDKNSLPVMTLRFGGLKYPMQEAKFSLGPLSCSGMDADARKLNSCLALKKAGHRSPAYYMMDSPEQDGDPVSRVAKCNLDLDPADPKFEEEMKPKLSRQAGVIFSVRRKTSMNNGDIWNTATYDGFLLDVGGGMNLSTGIFTSPVTGIFYFTFLGFKDNSGHIEAKFLKNGKDDMGAAYGSGYNDYGQGRSLVLAGTIQMSQNDTIEVYIRGNFRADTGRPIQFMGHLLLETEPEVSA